MKFVFALSRATGHETAQLYKATCCFQDDRSSISGLVEWLLLFHVNTKSACNHLLMMNYFCWDAEQWLHMALNLSKAVFEFCLFVYIFFFLGRNSVVDTETCYGLDGPGVEYRPVRLWAFQAPYTTVIGSFSRVQQQGCGVNTHPNLTPRSKKKRNYTSPLQMRLHGELSCNSLIYL